MYLYLSACVSVCVSRFAGLYLSNYSTDFNETWWMFLMLGPIDLKKKNQEERLSDDVILTSVFSIFLSKLWKTTPKHRFI